MKEVTVVPIVEDIRDTVESAVVTRSAGFTTYLGANDRGIVFGKEYPDLKEGDLTTNDINEIISIYLSNYLLYPTSHDMEGVPYYHSDNGIDILILE